MTSIKNEILRKLIHLSSIWIPCFYAYFDQAITIKILTLITLITCTVDFLRRYSPFINAFILKYLSNVIRIEEKENLSGASYFLISALISIVFFSQEIAIFALSVLIFSDTCASLVGKYFGKIKIFTKTLEGSMAFFVSAIMVLLYLKLFLLYQINFYAAIFAIFIACISELFAKKISIDDNLLIPLVIGMSFKIVSYV